MISNILFFFLFHWFHEMMPHPKMVTPAAGRPRLLAMPLPTANLWDFCLTSTQLDTLGIAREFHLRSALSASSSPPHPSTFYPFNRRYHFSCSENFLFANESQCQMPWKEMPRNSGIKPGRWSVRFPCQSQHRRPHLTPKQIFEKSWKCAKISFMLCQSRKGKLLLRGHWSVSHVPLSHSTSDRRLIVFG